MRFVKATTSIALVAVLAGCGAQPSGSIGAEITYSVDGTAKTVSTSAGGLDCSAREAGNNLRLDATDGASMLVTVGGAEIISIGVDLPNELYFAAAQRVPLAAGESSADVTGVVGPRVGAGESAPPLDTQATAVITLTCP